MKRFWLEAHDDHIILTGRIHVSELLHVLERYCNPHWIYDDEWAKDIDANFVFCTTSASSQRKAKKCTS